MNMLPHEMESLLPISDAIRSASLVLAVLKRDPKTVSPGQWDLAESLMNRTYVGSRGQKVPVRDYVKEDLQHITGEEIELLEKELRGY